jgi:uncharacterized protein (TIGR03790 family)
MLPRPLIRTVLLLQVLCSISGSAYAQSGQNVLIVANETWSESVDIATRYAAARRVPDDQVLRLKTSQSAEISRADFERDIQAPIATWLAKNGRQDRILYIVLSRGFPLRIAGTSGRNGSAGSIDSELTLLYRRMTGVTVAPQGPVPNPYFAGSAAIGTAKPFNRVEHDIYLVTRLDGFTAADAGALIDRAAAPVKTGRILLDQPQSTTDARGRWFEAAASRLAERGWGDRVVHETTSRALTNEANVLGYYSWASNDPALADRHPNLTFVPGAVAATFLSSDARTLTEPPADWKPGGSGLTSRYAGTSQSLTGDLIRAGVTGVAGQVAEPYLDGAIRPDILFPAYVGGFNLAEAFYLAMPHLSWQTVVFGDPLCSPFGTGAMSEAPDAGVDPQTELPAIFTTRRLKALEGAGTTDALKLLLRAEARFARSDTDAALEALKKALAIDDRLVVGWRALAAGYEQVKRFSQANEAYRRLLAMNPNDVAALNNLAYNLAVHEKRLEEALPMASRAATLAKGSALVEDTLGWIHYLGGNYKDALPLLERASRALPGHADVQFHAALVFAAVGRLDDAARALKTATEIDPALKERPEWPDLSRKLSKQKGLQS